MQEIQEHLPACLRSDKFVGNEPPEYFVRGVDDCTELNSPSPQPSPVKGEGEERLFCIWLRGGAVEPAWVDSGHSRPSPFGPSPIVMSAPA